MKTFLLSLLLALSSQSASAYVRIYVGNDCERDWMSTSVDVSIGTETFYFRPSCNFSLWDTFRLRDGTSCTIRSPMCSGFSFRKEVEVRCDNGEWNWKDVPCKEAN